MSGASAEDVITAHLALNRFGLGARPGEAARLDDPRTWLRAQVLAPPAPLAHEAVLPGTAAVMETLLAARGMGDRQDVARTARERFRADVAACWTTRARSDTHFFERWLGFFVDHFTVSAVRTPVAGLWGAYVRDALRPRVLGRFEDLLLAVVRHPAMLLYLDNAGSIGPDSPAGRRRGRGLNENLAREILELHTLGVDGGYDQSDIQALAAALTGWTVARRPEHLSRGPFRFAARAHQPGPKTVLGRRVAEGEAGGVEALRPLARQPATARFVCGKLARHLLGAGAPAALVEALVTTWRDTAGDLSAVARTLVDHEAGWEPGPGRLKSPDDLVASLARALGVDEGEKLARAVDRLAQPTGRAPSPAGFEDTEAAWLGPEGLLTRIDLAVSVANRHHRRLADPVGLGRDLLGQALDEATARRLAGVGPRRGLILLFASPAFQRR